MKQAYIYKSASALTEEKLGLIEKYSRRRMSEDEIYTFSLVLCDNEIDRDNERFTIEALQGLAGLFLGKTGIFDHNPKGSNQTARIFFTEVKQHPDRKTAVGEVYTYLSAEAYMVRCPKNEDLILEIEAGIKKEVSVGCSMRECICSVCGKDINSGKCGHIRGREYGGAKCHAILARPADAYEWSFVAVPAQLGAGVTKSFVGDENMQDVLKMLEGAEELHLNKNQAAELRELFERLTAEAEIGREYAAALKKEVVRLGAVAQPGLDPQILAKAVENLTTEELGQMKAAFRQQQTPQVQLMGAEQVATGDSQFKI